MWRLTSIFPTHYPHFIPLYIYSVKQLDTNNNGMKFGEITAFAKFLESVGCSRTTGYRWRKNGWIATVTIAGRPYVRREAIDKFLSRAEAGEFADNASKDCAAETGGGQ